MKKEFEGAAAATIAPSSTADKNVFEPKLVTIQDEAAQHISKVSGIVPEGGLGMPNSNKEESAVDELDVLGASSAASVTGLPPLPPQGGAQGGKNPLAAKLEATRKFSQSLAEAECDIGELELEDEEFDPHFQRVYISGDDNTGVSLKFCRKWSTAFWFLRVQDI